MSTFKEFMFRYAYDLVSTVCREVYENLNEMNAESYYDEIEQSFLEKIIKPQKFTLLHEYIDFTWDNILSYTRRKIGESYINGMYMNILDSYNILFSEQAKLSDEKYCNLLERLMKPINKRIVEETFTILFNDRLFLIEFNEQVSTCIKKMKISEFPNILEKDGVVKRCVYFPVWLKNAIFYRDKGRCQGCGKDLSNLLTIRPEEEIHYDHVVPLERGGTNDPTNIQLLCKDCNLRKSDKKVFSSNLHQTFW